MQAIIIRIMVSVRKTIHIHMVYSIIWCITSLLDSALLSFLAICGLFSTSVSLWYRVFKNHDRCLRPVIIGVYCVSHWFYCYQSNLVLLSLITLVIVKTIEVYLLSIFVCGAHIFNDYYRFILSIFSVLSSIASVRNLVKIISRFLLSSRIKQQFFLLELSLRLTIVLV